MKGAESWVFSLFRVVGAEVQRGGKGQVTGILGGSGGCRERRAVAEPRCGGRFGRCWVAYGLVVLVAERRYGTPALGRQGALRRALRGGSGAGGRVRLGRP